MAKGVYDALRRADEERRRKANPATTAEAPVMALPWEPDVPEKVLAERVPFYKRWFSRTDQANLADTAHDWNKRRISLLQPESFVTEQYRMLRGRIDSLAAQRPLKIVVVASANAGEGKSTAAINLAAVSAMGVGRKVLLIDCDLRRPKIHQSLGLEPQAGLAEVLMGEATFDEAVMKVDNLDLDALGVRSLPPNPSELLASDRMRELLEEVAGRYDRVILDSPAALGLPDAKIVCELADGFVMVLRADKTPREDTEVALDVLGRRRALGMVLNGVDPSRERYSYY